LTNKEHPKDSNSREVNEPNDPNAVKQDKHIANEHIFCYGGGYFGTSFGWHKRAEMRIVPAGWLRAEDDF